MSELPLAPATRQLGTSGIEVSPIAWGMWRLAENGRSAFEHGWIAGANLIQQAIGFGLGRGEKLRTHFGTRRRWRIDEGLEFCPGLGGDLGSGGIKAITKESEDYARESEIGDDEV